MPKGIYDRTKAKPNPGGFKKGHPDLVPKEARIRAGKKISIAKKGFHPVTEFRKGTKIRNTGRTRFKKGQHPSPATEFKKGQLPVTFKGRISNGKYIFLYKPEHPYRNKRKYVLEHRFMIEQHLKRYLLPKEQSHHINGNKIDNRLENLMLFASGSAHQRFHHHPDSVKLSEIIFNGREI